MPLPDRSAHRPVHRTVNPAATGKRSGVAKLGDDVVLDALHAHPPLVIVSRRLDHRRVSTTLDKYAHAVPGGDAQASATLRQILTLRPS